MRRFMFATAAATCSLTMLILLCPTHAIYDDFDGFLHYHEVDATADEIIFDASDMILPPDVWSAVCEEIPRCVAFNNKGFLKAFPRNESVDTYISKTHCGVHGKANLTEGSCLKPNSQFVHCHDDRGNLDTFYNAKANYPLPPHLVADACRRDNRCAGFMVTQDRQIGVLLEHFVSPPVTDIWTRVPMQSNATPTTTGISPSLRGPYRLRLSEEH
ncbi:Hypothetical protein NocV09_01201330 [Nannochloropsis oceanica]